MSNDIDERMAALLKDHQQMGARPADGQPVKDTYPLPPTKVDDEPKKAAKKK